MSSIQEAKDLHRLRIDEARNQEKQATLALAKARNRWLECVKTASLDGVPMKELEIWTGFTRQWLRRLLDKEAA